MKGKVFLILLVFVCVTVTFFLCWTIAHPWVYIDELGWCIAVYLHQEGNAGGVYVTHRGKLYRVSGAIVYNIRLNPARPR